MVLGIFGASGLGTEFRGLANVIQKREHRWDDIVFVDDDPQKKGTYLNDKPVYSLDEALRRYKKDEIEFIVAIGEPVVKELVFNRLVDEGCQLTTIIHPDLLEVAPEGAVIGKGVLIHKRSAIPPNSRIGNGALIQAMAIMGHDVVVGDFSTVSSFAFIGGDTVIGRHTYIGPSSCLRNGLHIGDNVIVGMGSVVTKDIPDNAVVYGNPAKIARYNDIGRVFSK